MLLIAVTFVVQLDVVLKSLHLLFQHMFVLDVVLLMEFQCIIKLHFELLQIRVPQLLQRLLFAFSQSCEFTCVHPYILNQHLSALLLPIILCYVLWLWLYTLLVKLTTLTLILTLIMASHQSGNHGTRALASTCNLSINATHHKQQPWASVGAVQQNRWGGGSVGKIVKNGSNQRNSSTTNVDAHAYKENVFNEKHRMRTEASTTPSCITMTSHLLSSSTIKNRSKESASLANSRDSYQDKVALRTQPSIQDYNTKLATYQRNKREVLRDIGRINTSQYIAHDQTKQVQLDNLKYKPQPSLMHRMRQSVIAPVPQQHETFLQAMDKQVRLENKLRKLKLQIHCDNRKAIKDKLKQMYSSFDCDRVMGLAYEQYELTQEIAVHKDNNNSNNKWSKQHSQQLLQTQSSILCEKLIECDQQCEHNWQHMLHRKFTAGFIMQLFRQLSQHEDKIGLSLKQFVREFNVHFVRKYHAREMFKIYSRLQPITKCNFVYVLSR